MAEFIHLQILPGRPAPLIALTSSGAQAPAVPATPFALPSIAPSDGLSLWQALPAQVQSSLRHLYSLQPQAPIALWLDVQLPEVAAWPWELLSPAADLHPFACTPATPLARAHPSVHVAPPTRPGALCLLALTARPRDQPPIDPQPMLELLGRLEAPGSIAVKVRKHWVLERLPEILNQIRPDLLVLMAHGKPGALVLEDENGDSFLLPAKELALLLNGSTIRAVVLASCDGATPADGGRSTATALLDGGALAVAAMRGQVPQNAADAFLEGLLRGVARGLPFEVAAAEGRKQIVAALGMRAGDWMLPVCWQRAIGRPLVLPAQEAVRRGAQRLAVEAQRPSWAGALAAGGWLGLLAVFSLQSLILPQTIAVPAIVKLLEGLGLNVMAGYLGETLKDIWRRAGKQPAGEATHADIVQALVTIAAGQQKAAEQTDHLARASGALEQTLQAIRDGVCGGDALQAGLRKDLERHGAALVQLDIDIRQGLRAVYQQGARIEHKADTILEGVEELRARRATERAQQEARDRELLDRYLGALIEHYRHLRLSRFVDAKTGADERAVPELYLEEVFTALTTDGPLRVVREEIRNAVSLRRLHRAFARRSPDRVPPESVRLLRYRSLRPANGRRLAPAGPNVEDWLSDVLPDDLAPDELFRVQVLRPELAVEAMAPLPDRARRLVLLGDPGSGKSTVLRYVAVLMAQAWRDGRPPRLAGWPEARIPLLLPLGPLAERLSVQPDAAKAVVDALIAELSGSGELRADLAVRLIDLLPRAILLLDGLDELSAEPGSGGELDPRRRVALALRGLARDLPETPIVVTCRTRTYRARESWARAETWRLPVEDGWQERTVQPFALGQVRRFVANWYHTDALHGGMTPWDADARTDELLEELRESKPLREAIAPAGWQVTDEPPASPLLLTMLTILHYNAEGRRLPTERADLYEELVNLLLDRWEPRRSLPVYKRKDLVTRLAIPSVTTIEPLRPILHQVAYKAHSTARGGDGRGIIDARYLAGSLSFYFRDNLQCDDREAAAKARVFLEALNDEAGLLTRLDDDTYALPHLTFQEYLAGCYLAEHPQGLDLAYEHWRGADAERWREVLLLMMGRLRQQRNVARVGVPWLKRLADTEWPAPAPPGQREPDWRPKGPAQRQRDALLAADCYAALGYGAYLGTATKPKEIEAPLREALLAVISPPDRDHAPALHLPVKDRHRAALTLARLGDVRLGVCTPRPDWCEAIPAGEYLIGTQHDPKNKVTFNPQKIHLDEFRIARYPVTVWQFRQFLEAGSYNDERWWTPHGREWKQRYSIIRPRFWDDPDWTADNQPVVGISWYEAFAFCSWLTAHGQVEGWLDTGMVIRLPSEAEWGVAAMWDARAGRMRSWRPPEGEFWQNVHEAGIGRTSPVGLFPQGASPCGALDMAGNIWEWCSSHYEDYPQQAARLRTDFSSSEYGPALRGWAYYLQNVDFSWSARGRSYPQIRDVYRGCRACLCSAPKSADIDPN